MLKFFHVDRSRAEKVVDTAFYQMDLIEVVRLMRKLDPDEFSQDLYPCWTKTVSDPLRGKGFFIRALQAIFTGLHGIDAVHAEFQMQQKQKHRVAMMFLPGSTKNEHLATLVEIAQEALPNFEVIEVSGNTMTNASAEGHVKAQIENARIGEKSVLILSAGMASRSFSIPEITELYLAFDGGSEAAVIQKMSRALTPSHAGKIGRIFSLSFDPNRDCKFDALIIQTATNYKRKHGGTMKAALRKVLSTIDLFRCLPDGAVKFSADTYLEQLLERDSIARYVGKTADFAKLTWDDVQRLAHGKVDTTPEKQDAADHGKVHASSSKNGSKAPNKVTDKAEKIAREMITTIIQNVNFLYAVSGKNTMSEAIQEISKDHELKLSVEAEYGVTLETIGMLLDRGIINRDVMELIAK